jgi:ribosomal protein S18 acetylase RimI-like enzyme
MENLEILEARTDWEFTQVRMLFEEYAAELRVDLCFQNFENELQNIRTMYSAPSGCLLLARTGTAILGCVAYRPHQDTICEMKRLYVRPSARGADVGRRLAGELIRRARAAGYTNMLLDTLRPLKAAHSLYQSLGFREVEPYYQNPLADVVYMELNL